MFGSERRKIEREIERLEATRLELPFLPDPRTLNIARAGVPMLSTENAITRHSSMIADLLIECPDARVTVDREAIAQNLIEAEKSGRPTPPLRFQSIEEDFRLSKEFQPGTPAAQALHENRLRELGFFALDQ